MKITKQRLKEIIREEFQRGTPPGDGFGDYDDGYDLERPPPKKKKVKEAFGTGVEPDLPSWQSDDDAGRNLEVEDEKGRIAAAAALGTSPEDPSLWQKILAAVEKANLFPRTEQ